MSDYHIRELGEHENGLIKTVNVVFHIPIPVVNNAVGVPYREALVRYLGGADAIESVLPEVRQTAEESDMKAGAVFEKPISVRLSSVNLTDAQRLAEIEAAYTKEKTAELNAKQLLLKYYGKVGDVA